MCAMVGMCVYIYLRFVLVNICVYLCFHMCVCKCLQMHLNIYIYFHKRHNSGSQKGNIFMAAVKEIND